MNNANKLIELAKKGGLDNLNKAEEKLFHAVVNGETADYSAKTKRENDPAETEKWGEERTIRADCIYGLCTDLPTLPLVTHHGIHIKGAYIKGTVYLRFAKVSFPLRFEKCAIPEGINLEHAGIRALNLGGTHIGPIKADGLRVDSGVYLRDGFEAKGEVRLVGATIGGGLTCSKGRFINPNGVALNADGIKVERTVNLRDGFKAEGEVRLVGGTIGGDLNCEKGEFINPKGYALGTDRLRVDGGVYLRNGFKAEGEVHLNGTKIGGNFDCTGGQFINNKKQRAIALNADQIEVGGSAFLRQGFVAEGTVRFAGATIDGQVDCSNAYFKNPELIAFDAERVDVGNNLLLSKGFKAEGLVHLFGATIGGNLDCEKGEFINKEKKVALNAQNIKIKGDVILSSKYRPDDSFKMQFLLGDNIIEEINVEKGKLKNKQKAKSIGYLFGDAAFKAEGRVIFASATIDGQFMCTDIAYPDKLILDLRSAKIGTLHDHENGWPEKGKLFLDGLIYDYIYEESPEDTKMRIDWLHRQDDKQFRPQPYEQLATVLRKSGHEEDAKKILIQKNKDRARLTRMSVLERCWHWLLGVLIGYGYRPLRVLGWILLFIILGSVIFEIGRSKNLMMPVKEGICISDISGKDPQAIENYSKFNALMYSLDTFVPLVDLHQANHFLPNAIRIGGRFLWGYVWIETIVGWILTTLFIVGLTGLLKR